VHLVRVVGEVQRGQGCRLACAGAHGVVVIPGFKKPLQ
jgi:hypothetical protein